MRFGLVTDSACDLPRSFFDDYRIAILPISIRSGQRIIVDKRDPAVSQAFYRDTLSQPGGDYESIPYSKDQIRELFLSRLVLEYDYVFCITVMGSRSLIYENATQASFAILNSYRQQRARAGVEGPFKLLVVDSRNLFPGQGVIVAEAARRIREGGNATEVGARISELSDCTQTFLMPAGLVQLRNQARKKGDKSMGFISYALGQALDIKPIVRGWRGETGPVAKVRGFDEGVNRLFQMAAREIEFGLKAPTVVVSYGGDPQVIPTLPGYVDLFSAASSKGVTVLTTEMSLAAGVDIGPGGLAIAFASERETTF